MAVIEATRPAYWVQDAPAISPWPLALSQTKTNPDLNCNHGGRA
jgi:hypothetical protein